MEAQMRTIIAAALAVMLAGAAGATEPERIDMERREFRCAGEFVSFGARQGTKKLDVLYAVITKRVSDIVGLADFGQFGTVSERGLETPHWVSHVTLALLRDCLHGKKRK